MTKKEMLDRNAAMRELGFMTHDMILELYNDTEQIPQMIDELICYERKVRPPQQFFMSQASYDYLQKILQEYIDNPKVKKRKTTRRPGAQGQHS